MKRLGAVFVTLVLAAGCQGGTTSNRSSTTTPPFTPSQQDDDRSRVTEQLESTGYQRTPTDKNKFPADFINRQGDMVHMSEAYPKGADYFIVAFPEGNIRCDNAGITPAGIQPGPLIQELHKRGRKALVNNPEDPTCKPV